MTFSADGMVNGKECWEDYKKRPGSKKRAFQKVETKGLAGTWCVYGAPTHIFMMIPGIGLGYFCMTCCMESYCPTKKVLDQDRYEESQKDCCDCIGCTLKVESFTRIYANGHPTNGFATDKIRSEDYQWGGPFKPEIL
tara:strand:+ start:206 stop:619 length:414 start_codon:yes stop_codon:yes gene_type:complete